MVKKTHNDEQPKMRKSLSGVQKRIYTYAAFAVLTIMLTVVLLFAATTAWYTNVAKTSDLVFEAAKWGFEGKVDVGVEEPIKAAPGESGAISLRLENTSDSVVCAGVNISKELMDTETKKRVFFYVDQPATVNGEVVDRVYLNSSSSHTYTVLPQRTLSLGSDTYNDAPLKWEWVYDVLGYYFEGTYDEASGKMAVTEYLRPVVYDYDKATFIDVPRSDGEGTEKRLETVDGTTTVEEFVVALTKSDGYPGYYEPNETAQDEAEQRLNPHGYFPVSVNERTGHGIWIYLCTWAEIEAAISYDTEQGRKAAEEGKNPISAKARISVYGQQEQFSTVSVNSAQSLNTALTDSETDLIKLAEDVELTSKVTVSEGKRVILDLNGKKLSYSGDNFMLRVENGSELVLYNGSIHVTGGSTDAIQVHNAVLTMDSVNIVNGNDGIVIQDNLSSGQDSCVRLSHCNIESGAYCGIMVFGNGTTSEQQTRLLIEDSTIKGGYAGILGNGTVSGTGYWGTEVQLLNSTVEGGWCAIYQPQKNSSITVQGGTLTGYTGAVIKGGSASFTDCKISGTGEAKEPKFDSAGFTDTGDGVYVETNYAWDISVDISGACEVTSAHAQAVRQYQPEADNASIQITGGSFSSNVSQFTAAGYICKQEGDRFVVKKSS